MNIKEIKNKLLFSKEYKFLWENEKLNNNIILLTTGGSHSYGVDVEDSDLDIRGVTLNTTQEILTMRCRDKPYKDSNTDTVIYTLNQIIELLIRCNPNIVEIFGNKQDHYFILSDLGKLLKDNINLFISQEAINSFGGYALAQLRRLQNALARDSYTQNEKEEHILNSFNRQLIHFKNRYEKFTKENIDVYIDKSNKEGFDEEIFIDIDLKHYPFRDLKNILSEMTETIRNYNKLNHRNRKKDKLKLNKHALHLIRLLLTGIELLEGKGINTYRNNDRDFLLDIRHGKYSYQDIFEMVNLYESKFQYAAENTCLPKQPYYNKINDLVIEINKKVIENAN